LSAQAQSSGDPGADSARACLEEIGELHGAGDLPAALAATQRCEAIAYGEPLARVLFNRGSLLFESRRFDEAEHTFAKVFHQQSELAPLAAVNAAFAALEQREFTRVATWEARLLAVDPNAKLADPIWELRDDLIAALAARQAPSPKTLNALSAHYLRALASDPRASRAGAMAYDLGVLLYNAELLPASVRLFSLATKRKNEGAHWFMLGRAAFRAGDEELGRHALQRALPLELPAAARRVAKALLAASASDALSIGWHAAVSLGAGHDTNVSYSGSGVEFLATDTAGKGSAYFRFVGQAGHGKELSSRWSASLDYSLGQLLFADSALDAFRQQTHDLTLQAGHAGDGLSLEFSLGADALFVGTSDFQFAYAGATAMAGVRHDFGRGGDASATLSFGLRNAGTSDYDFVEGPRTEFNLVHHLETRGQRAGLTLHASLRDERTGTQRIDGVFLGGPPPQGESSYVIPHKHWAIRGSARGTALVGRFLFLAEGGYERRMYRADSFIETTQALGTPLIQNQKTRLDAIGFGGAQIRTLVGRLTVGLSYDLYRSNSNIDSSQNSLDYDNKNFWKHVIGADVSSSW